MRLISYRDWNIVQNSASLFTERLYPLACRLLIKPKSDRWCPTCRFPNLWRHFEFSSLFLFPRCWMLFDIKSSMGRFAEDWRDSHDGLITYQELEHPPKLCFPQSKASLPARSLNRSPTHWNFSPSFSMQFLEMMTSWQDGFFAFNDFDFVIFARWTVEFRRSWVDWCSCRLSRWNDVVLASRNHRIRELKIK